MGYTPQRATAVWVGHPEADVPMTRVHGRAVTGGSFPAAIFADVMRAELQGIRAKPLETASPDDLSLHSLTPSTSAPSVAPPPTSSQPRRSTTSTSSPSPTTTTPTTAPPRSTSTTAPAQTTTTKPPKKGGGSG